MTTPDSASCDNPNLAIIGNSCPCQCGDTVCEASSWPPPGPCHGWRGRPLRSSPLCPPRGPPTLVRAAGMREQWMADMKTCRAAALESIEYNSSFYDTPRLGWTQTSFAFPMVRGWPGRGNWVLYTQRQSHASSGLLQSCSMQSRANSRATSVRNTANCAAPTARSVESILSWVKFNWPPGRPNQVAFLFCVLCDDSRHPRLANQANHLHVCTFSCHGEPRYRDTTAFCGMARITPSTDSSRT